MDPNKSPTDDDRIETLFAAAEHAVATSQFKDAVSPPALSLSRRSNT